MKTARLSLILLCTLLSSKLYCQRLILYGTVETSFIKSLSTQYTEYTFKPSPSLRSGLSFRLGSKNQTFHFSTGFYTRYQYVDYQFKRFSTEETFQIQERLLELGFPLSTSFTLLNKKTKAIHAGSEVCFGGIYGLNSGEIGYSFRPRLFSILWFKKSYIIHQGIKLELGLDYFFGSRFGFNPMFGIGYSYVLH